MARSLEDRLSRLAAERAEAAAARAAPEVARRCRLRAWAAIGAAVRGAVLAAGGDPDASPALRRAAACAAALAALPDTAALRRADRRFLAARDRADAGAEFAERLGALARRLRGKPMPDLANASLAALFAWSLAAMLPAHSGPPNREKPRGGVDRPGHFGAC